MREYVRKFNTSKMLNEELAVTADLGKSEDTLKTVKAKYDADKKKIEDTFNKFKKNAINKDQYLSEYKKFLQTEMEYKIAKATLTADTAQTFTALTSEENKNPAEAEGTEMQ